MKHTGTVTLYTEHCILRPFTLGDAAAMFQNWAQDAEVTRYLTWPAHKNVQETEQVLAEWVNRYNEPDFYQWCIADRADGQAIGSIGAVKVLEEIDAVETGYCLGRAYWGRGLMTEVYTAVLDFFFNVVGVNRVQASHDAKNPASGKVMLKCGLLYEGTRRKGARNQSGICDIVLYGRVKEDKKQ